MFERDSREQYDQLAVGNMIKKIRKSKGITLEELAKGICSTGKMSNIENGATSIDKETLTQFAHKLGVTVKQLTDGHSEEEKALSENLAKIEHMMGFGLYDDAHESLMKLIDRADECPNSSRAFQIKIHYLDGLLYKFQGNKLRATSKFYRVLQFPILSMDDVIYAARTYHNLAELHYLSNERTKAIELLEKGVETYASKNLDVPWIFHYNLAILHLFLSNPLKADIHIRSIRRQDASISYVDALIHLLNGNLNMGMKKLSAVRRGILEEGDQELIARSLLAYFYFAAFSPAEYESTLNHTILPFVENEIVKLNFTNDLQKEFIYLLLSCIVLFMIKRNKQELSTKYIRLAEQFDKQHKIRRFRYAIPYLKAMYEKSLPNKNQSLFKENLLQAKELMEADNITNLSYFNVLSELSMLLDESDTYATAAIKFMSSSFNLNGIDLIEREHLLPSIKEINI